MKPSPFPVSSFLSFSLSSLPYPLSFLSPLCISLSLFPTLPSLLLSPLCISLSHQTFTLCLSPSFYSVYLPLSPNLHFLSSFISCQGFSECENSRRIPSVSNHLQADLGACCFGVSRVLCDPLSLPCCDIDNSVYCAISQSVSLDM